VNDLNYQTYTHFQTAGIAAMAKARAERGGYLKDTDVAVIAADPNTRLELLLVRCGNGRFLAPAQDVAHFVAIIEEHANRYDIKTPGDYIRDVSIPATMRLFDNPVIETKKEVANASVPA
jgi:uncharacterized protein (DUF1786 family)